MPDVSSRKAFHRETVLPVVHACVIDRDLFASELVIRAARAGLRIVEIPIQLAEKRADVDPDAALVPLPCRGFDVKPLQVAVQELVDGRTRTGARRWSTSARSRARAFSAAAHSGTAQ